MGPHFVGTIYSTAAVNGLKTFISTYCKSNQIATHLSYNKF